MIMFTCSWNLPLGRTVIPHFDECWIQQESGTALVGTLPIQSFHLSIPQHWFWESSVITIRACIYMTVFKIHLYLEIVPYFLIRVRTVVFLHCIIQYVVKVVLNLISKHVLLSNVHICWFYTDCWNYFYSCSYFFLVNFQCPHSSKKIQYSEEWQWKGKLEQ